MDFAYTVKHVLSFLFSLFCYFFVVVVVFHFHSLTSFLHCFLVFFLSDQLFFHLCCFHISPRFISGHIKKKLALFLLLLLLFSSTPYTLVNLHSTVTELSCGRKEKRGKKGRKNPSYVRMLPGCPPLRLVSVWSDVQPAALS